ncbi:glycoside hydrolase [Dacryopinax primogenitus]|uniref:Glycoside hydrolase n=1 Tax=Dacryopinax primogenitus (strain DJM 731) TaxID=1858805 RepID=M5GF21_DACPD|nr:glycoside hydrolase [Dacryopinax primogenitus]EJU05907.1 glycoside hydrolase [Dacryopinax primogenitus]
MPQPPSHSPATGAPCPPHLLHTVGGHFVDSSGRTLLLRGVNLSGGCKHPPSQPSWKRDGFFELAEQGGESFVGKPLNLEDGSADVHLARLKGWGFSVIRYVITWEALEHEGPGKYDYEFMDYTVRVLRKIKEFGFKVYMDPHQDIWSRFSGGSGAPIWTLHACGLQPRHFSATHATLLHCEHPSTKERDPQSFPAMIWSTNYQRLCAQHLFALFFGGRDFVPKCVIDDLNIQDWLQGHFLTAVSKLAEKIRDAGDLLDICVIGWDPMNEPSEGFIGHPDLREVPKEQTLRKGTCPSAMQSLRLGMGDKVEVDYYEFGSMGPRKSGTVVIDPSGRNCWLSPDDEPGGHSRWGWHRAEAWKLGICPWALHGVWDPSSGICLRPDYFAHPPDRPEKEVVFVRDYWLPHYQEYTRRIRAIHPESIMFLQPPVFVRPPRIPQEVLKGRACYSPHYYDGLTLMTRHWNWFNADALGLLRGKYASYLQAVKIGEGMIRRSLREQLAVFREDVKLTMGEEYPVLIGEIGTPFDMDNRRAYGYTDNGRYKGDYSSQQRALDASLNAADGGNMLDYTIWTYVTDHSHEWGDGWNMEDLSLYSADDLREGAWGNDHASGISSASSSVTNLTAVQPGPTTPLLARQLPLDPNMSTLSLALHNSPYLGSVPAADYATGNLYRFLTNGARAPRAFARPYPVATIGTPKDIEFDVARADFRLTVVVRPEDAPPKRMPDADREDDDDEEVATEVYIPLVHYASDTLLRRGEKRSRNGNGIPRMSRSRSGLWAFQRSQSQLSLSGAGGKEKMARSALSLQIPVTGYVNGSGFVSSNGSGQHPLAQTVPVTPLNDSPVSPSLEASPILPSSLNVSSATLVSALVDVDVDVSEGKYDIEGQTLKWYYPVPAPGTDPVTYTLRVRRRLGPIKLTVQEEETLWQQCWNPEQGPCAVS